MNVRSNKNRSCIVQHVADDMNDVCCILSKLLAKIMACFSANTIAVY